MTTTPDDQATIKQITLADIPKVYAQPPAETLAKLPKPYSKDSPKGKCDVCGGFHGLPALHLDYMGHADVTLALLAIDPDWDWEPCAVDPMTGAPAISAEGGKRLVMWGRLTLLGKTRLGVGTCSIGKEDPEKELIGDFLRNAAMRFGIGTRLWSKADGDLGGSGEAGFGRERTSTAQQGQRGSQVQGRANPPRSSAPPVPDYLMALAGARDKNPAYVLSIARPIARKHGEPEPRIANDISPGLAATTADRMGFTADEIRSFGLDPAFVWPHLSDAQPAPAALAVDTYTDPKPVPLDLVAPGWSEAHDPEPRDPEPSLFAHTPGCTCADLDQPCLDEPF